MYIQYHRKSYRLKGHDYRKSGGYYFTICTKNRRPWFGHIKNNRMCVNEIGSLVYAEWYRTAQLRNNVALDEFIVMPDHIHGTIHIIGNNDKDVTIHHGTDVARYVPTNNDITNISISTTKHNKRNSNSFHSIISPKHQSLSSIIRGFKSAVSKHCHLINPSFQWQPRFHDHIIRNEQELFQIRKYIRNNPKNW